MIETLITNDIPIKNLYYILLYVWNQVRQDKDKYTEVGFEDIKDLNDIVATIFLNEVSNISKKGLYGKYIEDNYETRFIKGKIDISQSLYLIKPKISCIFDEFSKDNLLNQIIKSLLIRVHSFKDINDKLKLKSRKLLLEFNKVHTIVLDNKVFKKIEYNRLNNYYSLAVELGHLIYMNSIPAKDGQGHIFIDISKDEEIMSTLFEGFLLNFYKIHTDYEVIRKHYNWNWTALGNSKCSLIPRMETDVEIESASEKIIIDAKYSKDAFTTRYTNDKFKASHIYQITAYLENYLNCSKNLRGILIYPSNNYDFYEKFMTNKGYTVEFKTVNLNKDWQDIEDDLLSIFVQ